MRRFRVAGIVIGVAVVLSAATVAQAGSRVLFGDFTKAGVKDRFEVKCSSPTNLCATAENVGSGTDVYALTVKCISNSDFTGTDTGTDVSVCAASCKAAKVDLLCSASSSCTSDYQLTLICNGKAISVQQKSNN